MKIMKKSFIAPLATALVVSVSSAHGALTLNFSGVANATAGTGYGALTNTVDLTAIADPNAVTLSPGLYTGMTATNTGLGSGALSVSFSGGNAFDSATWAFTAQNVSGNNARGLGVATSGDTNATRSRAIEGTEVLVFTIDQSSLVLGSGEFLQFRVGAGASGVALNLFEQTGATAGASLESAIAVGTPSLWYNVDGLQTFAVERNGGTSQSYLGTLEFQVVPEPSSLALLGLGAGALFLRRRR